MGTRARKPKAEATAEPTVEAVTDQPKSTAIKAWKGFDKDLKCSPNDVEFQYEVGKTYVHEGELVHCKRGFHACFDPNDVFSYYAPNLENRYAEVLIDGVLDMESSDTKHTASIITVVREVSIADRKSVV